MLWPGGSTLTAEFINTCCLGNRDAALFCGAYYRYCHSIDDLIDRDNDEANPRDYVIKVQSEMFANLVQNPFFLAHKEGLLSLMLRGFHDWADSMDWQESGDPIKIYDADVLKGGYHAVFYHVALLVGGFDHARKISLGHRSFDHEPNNVKN